MKYQCEGCDEIQERDACPDVKDASERFEYGNVFTDKECPSCAGTAYRLPGMAIQWRKDGAFYETSFSMGEDIEGVGHRGVLRLNEPEFQRVCAAMRAHAENKDSPYDLTIEEGS